MMKLSHRLENNICVLSIAGDVKSNEIELFEEYLNPILENDGLIGFVINFQMVGLLSSAGVAMIMQIHKMLQEHWKDVPHQQRIKLALCELKPENWEIMSICGVDESINIYPTMQDALEALTT